MRERLEALENRKFFINMKDRWTAKDYRTMNEIDEEIKKIKKELDK